MSTRLLTAITTVAVATGALTLGLVAPAIAATGSFHDYPDNAPIEVDATAQGASIVRTFPVDLAGTVSRIVVTLDFHKVELSCSTPQEIFAWNDEINFELTSPEGTTVTLIGAGSLPEDEGDEGGLDSAVTYPSWAAAERVEVILDDTASLEVGRPDFADPSLRYPMSGTFHTRGLVLDSLIGETAAGDWELTVRDSLGGDPLCYYGASLDIETDETDDSGHAGEVFALAISPATKTVTQGSSIDFVVTAVDEAGEPVDIDGEYELSSSVASDLIEGDRVTFPTASPHVITATHLPSGTTATATVQVTATSPGTGPDKTTSPGELAATGADQRSPFGAAATALTMLGLLGLGLGVEAARRARRLEH